MISDINISLELVEDGKAVAHRKYLGQCNAKEYLDGEYPASLDRYGVWQQEGGNTRPWDFRHGFHFSASPNGSSSQISPSISLSGHLSSRFSLRSWANSSLSSLLS